MALEQMLEVEMNTSRVQERIPVYSVHWSGLHLATYI